MKNTKVVVRGPGAVLVTILRIPSLVFDMTNDLICFFDCLGTLDWSLVLGILLLLFALFRLRIARGFCLTLIGGGRDYGARTLGGSSFFGAAPAPSLS